MKHVVHRLPAPIWSGQGRSRAEQILALIEEAGGRGEIVETGSAAPHARIPRGPRGARQDAGTPASLRAAGADFP